MIIWIFLSSSSLFGAHFLPHDSASATTENRVVIVAPSWDSLQSLIKQIEAQADRESWDVRLI